MAWRSQLLLAVLMLCGFTVVGQLYVTIPLVPDIAARFGVTPASAALAGSAFGFAYAAGFLIFGPLADRHGRKRVILVGLIATAFGTALAGAVPSFGLLLAARALQGLAASTFPPAALSLVAEELPPRHRPLGISLMSFAFLAAAPIAQVFAGAVGRLPTTMVAVTPAFLIGAVGLHAVAGRQTGTAAAAGEARPAEAGPSALVTNPAIVTGWAAAFAVLFGFVSFQAGVQALNDGLGLDLQTLRLVGLPPLLLTLAAAPITRAFGPAVTARWGLVTMAAALLLATTGAAAALMAAGAILSAGVALAVPGLIATIAGQTTTGNRSLALAVYTFTLFVGASVAPPIAQALATFGTGPVWLLPAALAALAVLAMTVAGRGRSRTVSLRT